MTKLEKKIFNDANIIIISAAYTEKDLIKIEKIIDISKKYKKKLILTTKSPSFYYDNYLSIVDKFYNLNKRLPNKDETIILEKEYFKSMDEGVKILNKKIEVIAKNKNIKLLRKIDLFCDLKKQRCEFLTKNKDRILYDANHYSINGAKHIGEKVFYSNWLDLN